MQQSLMQLDVIPDLYVDASLVDAYLKGSDLRNPLSYCWKDVKSICFSGLNDPFRTA